MGLLTLFLILVFMSIVDIRSMLKEDLKREIIPYLFLMLLSGSVGFLYLTDPNRESIAAMFLNIFHVKG